MARRLPLLRTVVGSGVALLATAAVALFVVRIERVVTAPGRLVGGTLGVHAPQDGIVAAVLVRAGQHVDEGAVLVRLRADALDAERAQRRAGLALLDQQLANLAAEAARLEQRVHPAEASHAARSLELAEIRLESSQSRVELLRRLVGDGLVEGIELEDAEVGRRLAEVQAREAREANTLLTTRQQAGLEELQDRRRELERRRAQEEASLAENERRRAAATLRAPSSGLVVGAQLEELVGRSVAAGDELLRLAVARPSAFVAELADGARSKASVGDTVRVRLVAYPWILHGVLEGRVESVSERRGAGGGFEARVALTAEDAPGPLFEGMAGQARIRVDESVSLGRLLIDRLVGPEGS